MWKKSEQGIFINTSKRADWQTPARGDCMHTACTLSMASALFWWWGGCAGSHYALGLSS